LHNIRGLTSDFKYASISPVIFFGCLVLRMYVRFYDRYDLINAARMTYWWLVG